jgi:hypothetical protein
MRNRERFGERGLQIVLKFTALEGEVHEGRDRGWGGQEKAEKGPEEEGPKRGGQVHPVKQRVGELRDVSLRLRHA